MNMTETIPPGAEPDSRFPSGPWTGFFLQPSHPGRNWMELSLTFRDGSVHGDGRDRVGEFRITGKYGVEDGKCRWTKAYIGQHTLSYQGYNEGKGIWGTWEYDRSYRGGFRIWPVGMADPTLVRISEEVDEPSPTPVDWIDAPDAPAEVGEPVEVGSPARSRGLGSA